MLGRTGMLVQRRTFAAAAGQPVKLPVQLFGLSARYANALFVAASKSGELAKVETDLKTVAAWNKESATFREYLSNPIISRTDKVKDMAQVSKGMAESTRGFLTVLAENGRLKELGSVIKTFNIIMGAQRGVVEATVTAAEELTSKQLKAVEKAISGGYLEKGQSVNLQVKVDPGIIGGLQVQIGDRFLDLSVQSEINNVHKAIV